MVPFLVNFDGISFSVACFSVCVLLEAKSHISKILCLVFGGL